MVKNLDAESLEKFPTEIFTHAGEPNYIDVAYNILIPYIEDARVEVWCVTELLSFCYNRTKLSDVNTMSIKKIQQTNQNSTSFNKFVNSLTDEDDHKQIWLKYLSANCPVQVPRNETENIPTFRDHMKLLMKRTKMSLNPLYSFTDVSDLQNEEDWQNFFKNFWTEEDQLWVSTEEQIAQNEQEINQMNENIEFLNQQISDKNSSDDEDKEDVLLDLQQELENAQRDLTLLQKNQQRLQFFLKRLDNRKNFTQTLKEFSEEAKHDSLITDEVEKLIDAYLSQHGQMAEDDKKETDEEEAGSESSDAALDPFDGDYIHE